MAITTAYSGTATIATTEFSLVNGSTTLANITTAGVYQVFIDLSGMGAEDEYQIFVKEKVVSGGTQKNIYAATVDGVQATPFVIPSLILLNGWDVTMLGAAGTSASISWSIRKVG